MATWTRIKSERDYNKAVDRINQLIDTDRTDSVRNELGLLSFLIEEYEATVHPMPDASPLEVIKLVMEMKGIKQQDLIPILGTKGNVSKILSGKANLQLEDIDPLSTIFGIPVEALIPKADHPYSAVSIVAESSEPSEIQALDGPVKYWTQESSHWGDSDEEKSEQIGKKKQKLKR